MSESLIDYGQKVQEALRQVVRSVLMEAETDGLKGDHHFYIAFRTQADGVEIPDHLISRFPDEMTIVLQHKFWGLKVLEDYFEVGLSFNQKPELLKIPFKAVTGFVDPSVQFALELQGEVIDESALQPLIEGENDASQDTQTDLPAETPNRDEPAEDQGAKVVTLDAFRKK